MIPQHVQKVTFFAVVLPSDHPALSQHASQYNPYGNPADKFNTASVSPGRAPSSLSVKSPELVEALNKLDRNGLVTADVDLFVVYEGDRRQLAIRVQVIELAGKQVIHTDLLVAQITLPPHHRFPGMYKDTAEIKPLDAGECTKGDWMCRVGNWLKSFSGCSDKKRVGGGKPHGPGGRGHGGHHSGKHDPLHRHRFSRPRHGLRKFMISVVIPILIGAAAGVGIGILSVFIAEFVGGIIMRIRGRRNPGYTGINTNDTDVVDRKELVAETQDEEAEDEPLPVYQPMSFDAVPGYADKKDEDQQ